MFWYSAKQDQGSPGTDDTASTHESQPQSTAGLAPLPYDCPTLPTSYRSRPDMEQALLAALLATNTVGTGTVRATSITAPKSRVSSQGSVGQRVASRPFSRIASLSCISFVSHFLSGPFDTRCRLALGGLLAWVCGALCVRTLQHRLYGVSLYLLYFLHIFFLSASSIASS